MKKAIIFLTITLGILGLGMTYALAANPASVNTLGAENVELKAATFRGAVVSDGGCAKMDVWFEYGPTETYGSQTAHVARNGVGEFAIRAINLTPGQSYHFRAVARNNTGIAAYGSDRVFSTQSASFEVQIDVRNETLRDSIWYSRLRVQPGDYLEYRVIIKSTGEVVSQDLMANVQLPANVFYRGNLQIKGAPYNGDISRGTINVGNLLPGESKIITFEAEVGEAGGFAYGENILAAKATVYNNYYSNEGSCQIVVLGKGAVRAALASTGGTGASQNNGQSPTAVSTGISDNIFNSLLLPLLVAGLLVWLFRSKLLGLEEWAQLKRERTERFRTSKKLQRKIEEVRKNL